MKKLLNYKVLFAALFVVVCAVVGITESVSAAGDFPATSSDAAEETIATASQPTTGSIAGHDWVDLGLSVKWATCNVGASSPSDYGNYYAWGETTTKQEYTEENCKTYNKNLSDIAGDPQYDAACANWGGSWRLPTKTEMQELIDKCAWTWTTQDGHNGYKVTSKINGNSIFLPAAGWRIRSSSYGVGEWCGYWSSTPLDSDTQDAYDLYFLDGIYNLTWDYRLRGHCVRPVTK